MGSSQYVVLKHQPLHGNHSHERGISQPMEPYKDPSMPKTNKVFFLIIPTDWSNAVDIPKNSRDVQPLVEASYLASSFLLDFL